MPWIRPILSTATLCAALLVLPVQAQAQAAPGTRAAASRPIAPGSLDRFLAPHAPLAFSTEVKTLGMSSSLSNEVFKPDDTAGPFPAVVMTPSCGGVDVQPYRERLKDMLAAGYLVITVDSYKPRRQTDCRNGTISVVRVIKDTLDALVHLHSLPAVDKSRIYQVGFSMGAYTAAAVASADVATYFAMSQRFRASVGWYGSCGARFRPDGPASHYLRADTDRPVLMLLAEADRETPIRPFCFPLLEELKAAGQPVDWHVYGQGVTHAWDMRNGYTVVTGLGETVVNRYDAEASEDATRRTLDYLRTH